MEGFPYEILDLTHTLTKETPTWSGSCGFAHEIKLDYEDRPKPAQFRVQKVQMHAGIGTHIDAPAHAISGGKTVEEISLNDLLCPCVCIDVSNASESYLFSLEDLLAFEEKYGKVPSGAFVIIYTGWDRYWAEGMKYINGKKFPGVKEEVALALLERDAAGLGIDTATPDGLGSAFPVHRHLLGAGKYIVENIANAKKLPPTGSFVLIAPIKGENLTEAPIRLVAFC